MISVAATQLCCSSKVAINKAQTCEHGCYPIRLYLQNQVARQIWPVVSSLTPDLLGLVLFKDHTGQVRMIPSVHWNFCVSYRYLSSLQLLHIHSSGTEPSLTFIIQTLTVAICFRANPGHSGTIPGHHQA